MEKLEMSDHLEVHDDIDEDIQVVDRKSIIEKLSIAFSEYFGTLILVYVGCMGCTKGMENTLDSAWTFGLAVMTSIHIFGHVSGAHINPAVSVAAFIMDQIKLRNLAVYILAQLAGAVTGYALLMASTPKSKLKDPIGNCLTYPSNNLSGVQATFVEFVLTSVLVFAVCATWDKKNVNRLDSMALRIGLVVVALGLAGGNYTGASLNPSRSFGPALLNGNFDMHLVYWVGPLCGGIVAAYTYKILFVREK